MNSIRTVHIFLAALQAEGYFNMNCCSYDVLKRAATRIKKNHRKRLYDLEILAL